MSVRLSVISQVEQVAKEQKKKLAPLSDDLVLLDSGLDSLCFAIIVARLEAALGIDPFSTAEHAGFPVTLGDPIRLYQAPVKYLELAPGPGPRRGAATRTRTLPSRSERH